MIQNATPGFSLEAHSSTSIREECCCLLEGGQADPGEDSSVLAEAVGDRCQAEGGGSRAEPLLWTLPWKPRCRLLGCPQGTVTVLQILPHCVRSLPPPSGCGTGGLGLLGRSRVWGVGSPGFWPRPSAHPHSDYTSLLGLRHSPYNQDLVSPWDRSVSSHITEDGQVATRETHL